jgi:tyrosine-protein phosphatase SIW14
MVITTDATTQLSSCAQSRIFAVVQLGLALSLSLVIGCRRPAQIEPTQVETSKAPEVPAGVPNFAKVCEDLYRGGQPTHVGYRSLKDMGVHTIVTLRTVDWHSAKLEDAGIRTHHISFKHIHPETEDVLKFLSLATNPDNRPLFVHCRQGVDRTGMMIAVYRMAVQDWPRAKAIAEMKQMGFNDWNVLIERYLLNVDIKRLKREMAEQTALKPRTALSLRIRTF